MTTIAFDGKILAADTAHWRGDVISWLADKLHVLDDGYKPVAVYGWAGNYSKALPLQEWIPKLLNGEKLESREATDADEWQAIIVDLRPSEELRTYILSPDMILAPCGQFIAIGMGEHTAMAALRCGKDATQAVQLCCDTTAFTAGPVTAYDVKKRRYVIEL